jgi:hypothetical protein
VVSCAVLGILGFLIVRSYLGSNPGTSDTSAVGGFASQLLSGTKKYVPGVSDKELQAFMDKIRQTQGEQGVLQITEEQIYAIMGEPTRRESPVTVQKNGQVLTVYKAYWEHKEPQREISTLITFVNGRFAGGIIGLEVTPRDKPSSDKSTPKEKEPPIAADKPAVLSGLPADLLVGVWEAMPSQSSPEDPRQLGKVRLEFRKDGTVVSQAKSPTGAESALRGTWQSHKVEPPRLWVNVTLRRVSDNEPLSLGNPVLLTFRSDDEFESNGLILQGRWLFRRVPGASVKVPAAPQARRPLKEWVQGTWETEGSAAPQTPTGRPFPASVMEFRADGTFVSTIQQPGSAPKRETGTWEALQEFDQTLVVVIRHKEANNAPGRSYQMRLQFAGENELRYLIGDKDITPPTFRRKS